MTHAELAQRESDYAMWLRVAKRRKPYTRGFWRAWMHARAAGMILDSGYRIYRP